MNKILKNKQKYYLILSFIFLLITNTSNCMFKKIFSCFYKQKISPEINPTKEESVFNLKKIACVIFEKQLNQKISEENICDNILTIKLEDNSISAINLATGKQIKTFLNPENQAKVKDAVRSEIIENNKFLVLTINDQEQEIININTNQSIGIFKSFHYKFNNNYKYLLAMKSDQTQLIDLDTNLIIESFLYPNASYIFSDSLFINDDFFLVVYNTYKAQLRKLSNNSIIEHFDNVKISKNFYNKFLLIQYTDESSQLIEFKDNEILKNNKLNFDIKNLSYSGLFHYNDKLAKLNNNNNLEILLDLTSNPYSIYFINNNFLISYSISYNELIDIEKKQTIRKFLTNENPENISNNNNFLLTTCWNEQKEKIDLINLENKKTLIQFDKYTSKRDKIFSKNSKLAIIAEHTDKKHDKEKHTIFNLEQNTIVAKFDENCHCKFIGNQILVKDEKNYLSVFKMLTASNILKKNLQKMRAKKQYCDVIINTLS